MPIGLVVISTLADPPMNDTIKELTVTKSLRLLCNGFKNELASYVYADQRMTELLHELVSEFVEANIPVVDEDNKYELALLLLETLDVVSR